MVKPYKWHGTQGLTNSLEKGEGRYLRIIGPMIAGRSLTALSGKLSLGLKDATFAKLRPFASHGGERV